MELFIRSFVSKLLLSVAVHSFTTDAPIIIFDMKLSISRNIHFYQYLDMTAWHQLYKYMCLFVCVSSKQFNTWMTCQRNGCIVKSECKL